MQADGVGDGEGEGDAFAVGGEAGVLVDAVHHVVLDPARDDDHQDLFVGLDGERGGGVKA